MYAIRQMELTMSSVLNFYTLYDRHVDLYSKSPQQRYDELLRPRSPIFVNTGVLVSNAPFGEREKPSAHDFELCAKGRLLIIAPMTPLPPVRSTFLYLNSFAESISIPQ